jgi:hypothetical protein
MRDEIEPSADAEVIIMVSAPSTMVSMPSN